MPTALARSLMPLLLLPSLSACLGGPPTEEATGAALEAPEGCRWPVQVVVWDSKEWMRLGRQFAAHPSACAEYYLSVPGLAGDKTTLRRGAAEDVRALGPQFHAMAEFHWGTWSRWVEDNDSTWIEAGREFRRRMADAGFDVAAGDTWAINELPSSIRKNTPGARQHARNLVRALHEGEAGDEPARGAAFIVGVGQSMVNYSVYKPVLEEWLCDADFWVDMNTAVRFWGQEVYADPQYSCFEGNTAERSSAINEFIQHVPRLAAAGPSCAATARSYLSRAWVPLVSAAWKSDVGYGDTRISLDAMKHHVSTEVYAVRAWSGSHGYLDGRIGFAWAPNDLDEDPPAVFGAKMDELAERIARAVQGAYGDDGGQARHACSPSGAYTWCQCRLPGARRNTAWPNLFGRW